MIAGRIRLIIVNSIYHAILMEFQMKYYTISFERVASPVLKLFHSLDHPVAASSTFSDEHVQFVADGIH